MPDAEPAVATQLIGPAPRLAVDVAGEGPLVVFLHGIGGNRSNWQEQLAAFAGRYRAVAWDARGYGGSDDYDGPLAFDDFCHDLARVIRHFGERRAHLVGLSMGGRIAARFSALYPDGVATLILADTHTGFGSLSPEKREEFLATRLRPLREGKGPRDIAPAVVDTLIGPAATPAMRQRLIDSIAALHKESYIKSLVATVEQDTVDAFAAIRVPTLFLVGECDRLTPPDLARRMADRVPGAELVVLPGAGHLSNIERPEAFNAAALDFLARRG